MRLVISIDVVLLGSFRQTIFGLVVAIPMY